MTHYVDGVVGNLTAAMKAVPGMWANTLVIAASDNGGPIQGSQGGSNFPLRGGKLTPWEGGIRVGPLVRTCATDGLPDGRTCAEAACATPAYCENSAFEQRGLTPRR